MRFPTRNARCLSKLLNYQNDAVLQHFYYNEKGIVPNPESLADLRPLFQDLLAWLWILDYRSRQRKKTYMFGPLLRLDKLWHSFILHTQDYHAFCTRYFGRYLHHDVEPVGFEHRLTAEELRDFLEDCVEFLGQPWVERQFKV